jgi:hypothetical protein
MRALLATVPLLAACQPDLRPELAVLQAEIARQQSEIEALSAFVDAQANVITVCQTTLTSIANYVINTSTLGMIREASTQFDNVTACANALSEFDTLASQR